MSLMFTIDGAALRALREELGLSRSMLSRMSQVSVNTIRDIETQANYGGSKPQTVEALAQALTNVSPDVVWNLANKAKPSTEPTTLYKISAVRGCKPFELSPLLNEVPQGVRGSFLQAAGCLLTIPVIRVRRCRQMSSETTCSVWHFNASPQREDAPKWSRVPQSWFVDRVVEETGITVGDVTGNRAVIWGPGQWGKGPWSVQLYNQMNEPVEEFIAADFPSLVALMKELRAAFSF